MLNLPDLGILFVMLLKVQLCLFAEAGVDDAVNASGPLVKQEQGALIDKVVNQDNAPLGTSHKAAQKSVGVPHAACAKQFFGCHCGRQFFNLV